MSPRPPVLNRDPASARLPCKFADPYSKSDCRTARGRASGLCATKRREAGEAFAWPIPLRRVTSAAPARSAAEQPAAMPLKFQGRSFSELTRSRWPGGFKSSSRRRPGERLARFATLRRAEARGLPSGRGAMESRSITCNFAGDANYRRCCRIPAKPLPRRRSQFSRCAAVV